MSLGLLLPAALAALGALLMPLLIHLARRSQLLPTPFAALRWLRQAARPQRRVRLEEWPLLLLRLLLLALLALWLARPVLHGEQEAAGWTVAVPGVDTAQLADMAGSAEPPRWLAPGFPPLDGPVPSGPVSVASLLRQLDAELPPGTALAVAVPEWLHGMDAQRPALSRPVAWHVLGGGMEPPAPSDQQPPALQVRDDGGSAEALRYLRAAATAWHGADESSDGPLQLAPASQPVESDATHLVWLADAPVPAAVLDWVHQGGVLLAAADSGLEPPSDAVAWWRSRNGDVLVEGGPYGQGRLLRFTRPLVPAHMPELLDPDFPQRLQQVLLPPPPGPATVAASAHAPLQVATAWPQAPRELRPWLALLIGLLFLLERWLATSPRRPAFAAGGQP